MGDPNLPRQSDDNYRGGVEDDMPSERWRKGDRRRWE